MLLHLLHRAVNLVGPVHVARLQGVVVLPQKLLVRRVALQGLRCLQLVEHALLVRGLHIGRLQGLHHRLRAGLRAPWRPT